MPDNASDRTRTRSSPAPQRRSSTTQGYPGGAPVAGAPGWHVVRRKSRFVVLFERLLKRRPRLRLVALGGGAAGLAVLALAFSLVRAYRETPTERSRTSSMPPVAGSRDSPPEESRAASAEAPPFRPDPAPAANGQESHGQQDGLATGARQANADASPPHNAAAVPATSREGSVALTPQVQSRPRPLAATAPSQSPGGTPSRLQRPEPAARQSPPSSPEPAASPAVPAARGSQTVGGTSSPEGPAEQAPSATSQVADEASDAADRAAEQALSATSQLADETSDAADRPAEPASPVTPRVAGAASDAAERPAPAGEIRVFIHHSADRRGDATLAQRLAEHLRGQGVTVADIRPVDFSIGRASVRYFFEDDRSASERLVDELGRFFDGTASGAPDHASDFTHFEPKPSPGNVEIWLAG